MTKIVFVTVWYSSLYPSCFFFGALALMISLVTDKFLLMVSCHYFLLTMILFILSLLCKTYWSLYSITQRSWAPSPKLGTTISKLNRTFFLPLTAIVMTVISSFTWIGFNFDNLCGKPTERAILLLDNQHIFY